jgi:site-specific recombinase XerD
MTTDKSDLVKRIEAGDALGPLLELEEELTAALVEAPDAENTQRAYESDQRTYKAWCEVRGVQPLTTNPRQVVRYIAWMVAEGYALKSIQRHVSAISRMHTDENLETPTRSRDVRNALKNLKAGNSRKERKAKPLYADQVKAICQELSQHRLKDLRDRALLCLGFQLGTRRSELVSLDIEDLEWMNRGVIVTVERTKTAETSRVGVRFGHSRHSCPVRAVKDWVEAAKLMEGALFPSVDRWENVGGRLGSRDVARVIKERVVMLGDGYDSADYSGHSLRRGMINSARRQGYGRGDIMPKTGHRSHTAFDEYEHEEDVLDAALDLGL